LHLTAKGVIQGHDPHRRSVALRAPSGGPGAAYARPLDLSPVHAQFSEFSYGFAVTHELVARSAGRIVAAPELPSLIKEGQKGGGYDVKISFRGWPLFLQFKLAEYLSRSTAGQWADFCRPYYRFWLHAPRHFDQQQLLLDLESAGNLVFYAAPAFHQVAELDASFRSASVAGRSCYFRPSDIGVVLDDDAHCVTFHPTLAVAYLHSERREVPVFAFGGNLLERLPLRSDQAPIDLRNPEGFAGLTNKILMASERIGGRRFLSDEWLRSLAPFDAASAASRVLLGAELMFLLAEPEQGAEA
jgi:hypothetical protein